MAVETVVHLVRHAEVHNPDGLLYGRATGFPLTPYGQVMAEILGDFFAEHDLAAVRTSPLERARQTAAPLAHRHGIDPESDERLTEAGSHLQGQPVSLARPVWRQPRVWRSLWNPWRPSWGEPYRDVLARMQSAVEDARLLAAGREVVLVSHQMPIWVTSRQARGQRLAHDPRRRACSLASVTSLHFADAHLSAVRYRQPALAPLT